MWKVLCVRYVCYSFKLNFRQYYLKLVKYILSGTLNNTKRSARRLKNVIIFSSNVYLKYDVIGRFWRDFCLY